MIVNPPERLTEERAYPQPAICGLGDLQLPQPIDMLIRRYGLGEISF